VNLTGEQTINASREAVWRALNDPDVLQQCIPGCQSLMRDGEDGFSAVVAIKVGPIGARFSGSVRLLDIDAPNGCRLVGQGNGRAAGSAKGSAIVRLTDTGAGTILAYEVETGVGGRIAQLGGAVIDATARQLAARFFARFADLAEAMHPQQEASEANPLQQDAEAKAIVMPRSQVEPAITRWTANLGRAGFALSCFVLGLLAARIDPGWVAPLITGAVLTAFGLISFEAGRRSVSSGRGRA
jgi:carbon monoxide dehydrogenase subunit G